MVSTKLKKQRLAEKRDILETLKIAHPFYLGIRGGILKEEVKEILAEIKKTYDTYCV